MVEKRHLARRRAAEVFHPGSFLAEELEAREWTAEDLTQRTYIPVEIWRELLDEKRDIDQALAHALEAATGVSFGLWISLQLSWKRHGTE